MPETATLPAGYTLDTPPPKQDATGVPGLPAGYQLDPPTDPKVDQAIASVPRPQVPGLSPPKTVQPAKGQASIGAAAPSLLDTLGEAVGEPVRKAVESAVPKVADALNLHSRFVQGTPEAQSEALLSPEEMIARNQPDTTRAGMAKSAARGVVGEIGGLTTPTNLGMMAGGGILGEAAKALPWVGKLVSTPEGMQAVQRLISGGFTLQMMKGLYDQGGQLKQQIDAGDINGALGTIGGMTVSGAMTYEAGRHALRGHMASPETPQITSKAVENDPNQLQPNIAPVPQPVATPVAEPQVGVVPEGTPEPVWPKEYQSSPKAVSGNGGGGANYTADDLAKLKARNGIKDVPAGYTLDAKPEPIKKLSRPEVGKKLDAVKAGKVSATEVPQGMTVPKTAKVVDLADGRRVVFNPKKTSAETILDHAAKNELYKLTGDEPPTEKVAAVQSDIRNAPVEAGTPESVAGDQPTEGRGAVQDVILARHGHTALDQEGSRDTVAGHTHEPLDERGLASAQEMAEKLEDHPVTHIVTSDLKRAHDTAKIVGEHLDVPVTTDERLRPQYTPETEGKQMGEAKPIHDYYVEHPDERPPGGETFNEAKARQGEAIEEAKANGDLPVVVTHSRNIDAELGRTPEPGGVVIPEQREDAAPVYERTYRGPVDIETIEAIKNSPKYSAKVRDDARAVFEAVLDSRVPIDDAMNLNGGDELAKILGGKFDKTINAEAVKETKAPGPGSPEYEALKKRIEQLEKPKLTSTFQPKTAESFKRVDPPQVAQPLIKQRNVPFESKAGNGQIQHLKATEYILPGFEEYRIGITKPRGSVANHNKLGYEAYELTTGRRIFSAPHQASTEQHTIEGAMAMLRGVGKAKIDEAIRHYLEPKTPESEAAKLEKIKSDVIKGMENFAASEAKKGVPKGYKLDTPEKSASTTEASKVATKFRTLADNLTKQIDEKRREMTQNPTPKRMREQQSRRHDAGNLERVQKALRALAEGHENGTLPKELANVRTKDEIYKLVYKSTGSNGYYNIYTQNEYATKTPQAKLLQDLIEKKESPEARAEREKAAELEKLKSDVQFAKIPGYFPTPKPVVEKMLKLADIKPGDEVLEPSAGSGNIADAIRDKNPEAKLNTVEYQYNLRKILELKGHNLVADDFLEHKGKYDKIVMNPPFENGQDIEHVQHAYELLKPGGKIVAIMSAGPFFRGDKKATAFREWFKEHDGEKEDLASGTFTGKDAERQTGVSSRLVTIEKPLEVAQPAESVAEAPKPVYPAPTPGETPAPKSSKQLVKASAEAGYASMGALPIMLPINAAKYIDHIYDRVLDAGLEKVGLGKARSEIRQWDDRLADSVLRMDGALKYHKAEIDSIQKKVVGNLSRDQERGFVLLADKTTADYLKASHPAELAKYANDPEIKKSLVEYRKYEAILRDAVKELGGKTIDEDYLHRAYDQYTEGIDKKGKPSQGSTWDEFVTPQTDKMKGRQASPAYYYEKGLHEFGPSFGPRWMSVMTKLDEHRAAVEFFSKATRLDKGDQELPFIHYNGKHFFSPEMARQIREAEPGTPQAAALAAKLGISELPKPKEVHTYATISPFEGARFKNQALGLAKAMAEGNENAKGMAQGLMKAASIRYAGPTEIVDAFQHAHKDALPNSFQRFMAHLSPLTGFIRQQVVGLGFGVPHYLNILRRVANNVEYGRTAANPVTWPAMYKVLFDKELKARAISGVDDPTFAALLRHSGISVEGAEQFKHYIEGNLSNPSAWANAFRDKGREKAPVTLKSALTGVPRIAAQGAQLIAETGHKNLFKPGGVDQKARLWLADYLKEQAPKLSDAERAHAVNEALGRYNRTSWTEMQRNLGPLMLFPGWDFSSAAYVLKHPIRTALPPAIVIWMANRALNAAGQNQSKDKNDPFYIHAGKWSFMTNLLKEPMATKVMGAPLRTAQGLLDKQSVGESVGKAAARAPGDAGAAIVNTVNPLLTTPVDYAYNRLRPGSSQEIVKRGDEKKKGTVLKFRGGKAVEDVSGQMAKRVSPIYDRTTEDNGGLLPYAASLAGVTAFKKQKKR